jgi:hypothetical protein
MASPHYKHGRRSKYLACLPSYPRPPGEIKLASHDLETTLMLPELAGIRERLGAVMDDLAAPGDRLWKKMCREVVKETRCPREVREKLWGLPDLLPGVNVGQLCAALLETTANVLRDPECGPREAEAVFPVFCDRMQRIFNGDLLTDARRTLEREYGRRR